METLTVGELIEKLKRKPKHLPVFILTDKKDSNWDNENCRYIRVYPIEYVVEERYYVDDGWENGKDRNILLMTPEDEI